MHSVVRIAFEKQQKKIYEKERIRGDSFENHECCNKVLKETFNFFMVLCYDTFLCSDFFFVNL
jgi:hypothetical protein